MAIKADAAAKGLKAIGVTDAELTDVMKYYGDPSARIEAVKTMKQTTKGGDAIATANGLWLLQKTNSSFFNNMQVDLKSNLAGIARISTPEFEARRQRNLAAAKTIYDLQSYMPGSNAPYPSEEIYSPR